MRQGAWGGASTLCPSIREYACGGDGCGVRGSGPAGAPPTSTTQQPATTCYSQACFCTQACGRSAAAATATTASSAAAATPGCHRSRAFTIGRGVRRPHLPRVGSCSGSSSLLDCGPGQWDSPSVPDQPAYQLADKQAATASLLAARLSSKHQPTAGQPTINCQPTANHQPTAGQLTVSQPPANRQATDNQASNSQPTSAPCTLKPDHPTYRAAFPSPPLPPLPALHPIAEGGTNAVPGCSGVAAGDVSRVGPGCSRAAEAETSRVWPGPSPPSSPLPSSPLSCRRRICATASLQPRVSMTGEDESWYGSHCSGDAPARRSSHAGHTPAVAAGDESWAGTGSSVDAPARRSSHAGHLPTAHSLAPCGHMHAARRVSETNGHTPITPAATRFFSAAGYLSSSRLSDAGHVPSSWPL